MILSRRLSLSNLIELCRAMRHYLSAGLMLRDAFREQAIRGAGGVRPVAARIATELDQGHDLQHAMEREGNTFPPLLLGLASVGEETGMLPEVFGELERYFVRQQQMRRRFLASIAWPLIQFILAVLVIDIVIILIIGMLTENVLDLNKQRMDPLGLGLFGPRGAVIFLAWVGGILLGIYGLYLLFTRVLGRGAAMSALFLKVPIVGKCVRALALARFCLALRLTTESAMPIRKAIALSLCATSNAAFAASAPVAQAAVRKGEQLSDALRQTGLFPADFLNMLRVGEDSGRLDEVLEQQTDYYHDEAGRRLAVLSIVGSGLVWLFVGGVIITIIFRFWLWYLGQIEGAANFKL